jgi:hypothetical protein
MTAVKYLPQPVATALCAVAVTAFCDDLSIGPPTGRTILAEGAVFLEH